MAPKTEINDRPCFLGEFQVFRPNDEVVDLQLFECQARLIRDAKGFHGRNRLFMGHELFGLKYGRVNEGQFPY